MKRITVEQFMENVTEGKDCLVRADDKRGKGRISMALKMIFEELAALNDEKVNTIIARYDIVVIGEKKIGIDFPKDFDQKTLPVELQG